MYTSNAKWPKGTCDFSNNISTDKHGTKEQAEGICRMLEEGGFGLDGKVFPIKTWVEKCQ